MVKDIKRFCNLCQVCKQNKFYNAPQIPILTHPEVSSVWDRCHMDLIGHQYILTVIDSFSRFARCVAIKDKKMHTVARAMVDEVFCVVGVPNILYSDRGLEFTAQRL